MNWQETGALAFGLVIGWFLYLVNRYRRGDVQLGDITTVVAAIGGAAVTRLFSESGALFGAYGVGLAIGFFGYFIILAVMVSVSRNFDVDFFLDGRRRKVDDTSFIPGEQRQAGLAMDADMGAPPNR
ncbi:MAG TPA: hypothetical protein VGD10_03920 [Allosphingosinicella sp.]|uniref:hypothetical protein n=1 Tax=Allosphingosinicella sp. TaxID=2823234 RepID=UPI002ED98625